MSLFGIDVADLVNQHIAPGLGTGTITRYTETRDEDSPSLITKTSTSSTCQMVEIKNKQEFIVRGLKVGEVKIYLIVANSISPALVPEPGDRIIFGSSELNIVRGGVDSDPDNATYTVVCRA